MGAAGCFIDGRQNFKKDDFDKWDFDDCVEFYEEYKEETNYIGIDCTQIQQLDIDDLTGTFKGSATEATYTKGPHFLSLTKKMPHIFITLYTLITKVSTVPRFHLSTMCYPMFGHSLI